MKRVESLEKMMRDWISQSKVMEVKADLRFKKMEERMEASSRKVDEQQAKTDAQLAKTDAQIAKTDMQLAKTDAQLAKTDAQLAETDAQLAKTDAQLRLTVQKLKETRDMLHGFGLNVGATTEEFFFHALNESKVLGNIKFDKVANNLHLGNKHHQDEFDIVLYNGSSIGIVEDKHKVHPKDVLNLYTRKLENFRSFFPNYKNHSIYLGIAGFSIPQSVALEAKKRGIEVVRQKAEAAIEDNIPLIAY